jgi:hypothetical protein
MKKFFLTLLVMMTIVMAADAQYNINLNDIDVSSIFGNSNVSSGYVNNDTYRHSGYVRSNGTVVDSYMQTAPNHTNLDNYSTYGNSNPYTGTVGSRARDFSVDANNYGSGHQILTGSRGGQYYINDNGNKTYVPKRRTSSFGW